jgi:hypothetical protein
VDDKYGESASIPPIRCMNVKRKDLRGGQFVCA